MTPYIYKNFIFIIFKPGNICVNNRTYLFLIIRLSNCPGICSMSKIGSPRSCKKYRFVTKFIYSVFDTYIDTSKKEAQDWDSLIQEKSPHHINRSCASPVVFKAYKKIFWVASSTFKKIHITIISLWCYEQDYQCQSSQKKISQVLPQNSEEKKIFYSNISTYVSSLSYIIYTSYFR